MNRNTKIVLIILLIVAGLCLCGVIGGYLAFRQAGQVLSESVVTNHTQAAEVSREIVEFELPPGYTQAALRLFGFNMIIIENNQLDNTIMLMQFPTDGGMSEEQMIQQMQRSLEQQSNWRGITFTQVGEENLTVRGQEVTLAINEGSTQEGVTVRQMVGAFPGNQGMAVLMIMAPVETRDESGIAAFLSSIR